MRKKKLFILLFFSLVFIMFENVQATEFDAKFYYCNKIDCDNAGYYNNGKWEMLNRNDGGAVSIHFKADYNLYFLPDCFNDGFIGWYAYIIKNDDMYVFCEDDGSYSDSDIFNKIPKSATSCKNPHLFTKKFLAKSDNYSYVEFDAVYKDGYPKGISSSSSECNKPSGDTKKSNDENGGYSFTSSNKVSCGSIGSFHRKIPELTSWIVTILEIAVPVILVILGIIDFVKAIMSQKDDEIKRGQNVFIKRLVTGVLIFFIVVIVKLLVSLLATDKDSKNILSCIDCFISNKCN